MESDEAVVSNLKGVVEMYKRRAEEAAAEIERLRAALRKIASSNQQRSNCFCGACIQARAARAALEERT